MKLFGFGTSVIQRLVKTSVKKNLYWEIKDKVVEEAFNGVRSMKRTQKCRVFGLDSTRDVRARLIEILYERVNYHKDKFVAPIIHQEMQGMEVKKNGKVEHSLKTHDDQVFSYLMALYVWYDGKNLAENFHIVKNTLKTDQNLDIDEMDFEDNIEATEKIDFDPILAEPDSEIVKELEWVTASTKFITAADLREQEYLKRQQNRTLILATNHHARQAYAEETRLDESSFTVGQGVTFVTLPDSIFMDTDNFEDVDQQNSVLAGNMSDWWDRL